MTGLGEIRIVNDTPYRARQLAFCGVAFPPGLVRPNPNGNAMLAATNQPLGLQGWPSSIQATRAWSDGSVRYGRLLAVPRPGPNSDEMIPVGPAPELPFVFGAWAHLAAAIQPRLTVTRPDGSRIVSPLGLTGGANLAVSPAGVVSLVKQRIPSTCLWWSIRTSVGCDSDVIPFRLRLHNSDPTKPTVREDWAEIRFDSTLPAQFVLRQKLGLVPTPAPGLFGPESSISWRLSRADWLADAQGLWFWDGVWPLIDPAVHPADELERVESLQAAVTWPVVMAHTNMREPGMWGPFGNPGTLMEGQTLAQAEAAVNARAAGFRSSTTQIAQWGDWRLSEAPDTAQTGEHETHGIGLLQEEVLTANPRVIPELLLGSLGQARRPLYRYEASLEVVRKRDHPQLLYWSGDVHWVSQDKLGKTAQANGADKHFWSGPDPEHWMTEAFLGPAALLTMDWDLLEIGRQHVEHLKGHGYAQLGNFATRAEAWCSYAIAWWRLLLPEEIDDRQWVRGWQDWLVDWWLRKNARGEGGWGAGPGPVRPTIVMRDARYFWHPEGIPLRPDGTPDPLLCQQFWLVWQHHFAVWGLLALELVDRHTNLLSLVVQVARTVDTYGWDNNTHHPFGGVAWLDGGQSIGQPPIYVQDVWDPVRQQWTKTPGTVTSDRQTDWILWSEASRAASAWLAALVNDPQWLLRTEQLRQWIQAAIAADPNPAGKRAKLAEWGGTTPVLPVLS